jgi:transposase
MKRQLTIANNDGRRILYLDECMFTRATLRAEEWSRLKENFSVDVDSLKEPTLCLLSAISKERGQEHFKVFEKSVNVPKFKTYL